MSDIYTLFRGVTVAEIDLEGWRKGWETWLGGLSVNTRRAYKQGWRDLSTFIGWEFGSWAPWSLNGGDVDGWVVDMGRRKLAGSTIRQRVGAVSSFYGFMRERMNLVDRNPALGVRLPAVDGYQEAVYLDGEQVRALLRAIPRDTVRGKRDYALILFYVATGRRSGEVRRLRWGDFRQGEPVYYQWSGKNKRRWDICPDAVWLAVLDYLTAVERREKMRKDEYVFTAIENRASRLPHVDESNPFGRPLSGTETVRIVRKYAKAAGIETEGLRVHSLRHSHAMILQAVGMDTKTIQEELGHSSLKTTDGYLHALGGRGAGWARVREYLGL